MRNQFLGVDTMLDPHLVTVLKTSVNAAWTLVASMSALAEKVCFEEDVRYSFACASESLKISIPSSPDSG